MATPKPCCRELRPWLEANLHKGCFAPLAGADARALAAAVHILELYQVCDGDDEEPLKRAFGAVVGCMQPKCHLLAYHAIAMVMDWHVREPFWLAAGLPLIENPCVCKFEPQGRALVV